MDVSVLVRLFEKLASSDLSVDQHRCAVVRNRNIACKRCAAVCTTGCIGVVDGHLDFQPDKCIGCGTCATACPSGAIWPIQPTDDELVAASAAATAATGGTAVIACETRLAPMEGLFDPDKVVGVTCLGRIDESVLVRLADAGAQRIVLCHGECEACSRVHGSQMAQRVLENARVVMDAYGCDVQLDFKGKLPGITRLADDAGFNAGKRRFFSTLKSQLKHTADNVAETVGESVAESMTGQPAEEKPVLVPVSLQGTLPQHVPGRRTALNDWVQAREPVAYAVDTRLWGVASIDVDACASCRMCSTFCPTGAMSRFDDEDGAFGLIHTPALCTTCLSCQDICPKQAVSISTEVPTEQLAAGYRQRIELQPVAVVKGDAHSIVNNMRYLVGNNRFYER